LRDQKGHVQWEEPEREGHSQDATWSPQGRRVLWLEFVCEMGPFAGCDERLETDAELGLPAKKRELAGGGGTWRS